eukprot:1545361-Rhodomonas_salina.1
MICCRQISKSRETSPPSYDRTAFSIALFGLFSFAHLTLPGTSPGRAHASPPSLSGNPPLECDAHV